MEICPMKLRAPLAALSVLALSACGSSPEENTEAASETATQTPEPVVAVQQFVDTVSASDLYETEAGKLAQAKGTTQAVKDFGAMMVKDHATSTGDLKTAVATNPDLMLAPQLTAEQQTKLDQLKAANGSQFDNLYALQQVAAHEDALGLLKDYSTTGSDEALRGFAGKVVPVVEHHLEAAKKLP
jgi:putative membrane protein